MEHDLRAGLGGDVGLHSGGESEHADPVVDLRIRCTVLGPRGIGVDGIQEEEREWRRKGRGISCGRYQRQ